jgi:hypothetical protein
MFKQRSSARHQLAPCPVGARLMVDRLSVLQGTSQPTRPPRISPNSLALAQPFASNPLCIVAPTRYRPFARIERRSGNASSRHGFWKAGRRRGLVGPRWGIGCGGAGSLGWSGVARCWSVHMYPDRDRVSTKQLQGMTDALRIASALGRCAECRRNTSLIRKPTMSKFVGHFFQRKAGREDSKPNQPATRRQSSSR